MQLYLKIIPSNPLITIPLYIGNTFLVEMNVAEPFE